MAYNVSGLYLVIWINPYSMKFSCILFGLICLAAGCKKHTENMDNATIIGGDPRMSACLGGTFILIDGHPNPRDQHGYYDIGAIPSSFPLAGLKYPIKVKIEWHIAPQCYGNYVDITRIGTIP
jgi:hypothetical protein